ncbi:MAG: hypothetical protein L3J59_12485 [Methylococcaceae bacterium]|nr:hypothetical protein [Methylococcaceae bacterium]
MKKTRFYFTLLLLTGSFINTQAVGAEYNNASKELTVQRVKVDNGLVYDVKLKLKDFDILEISVSGSCPAQNATNIGQITNGMTLDQVNSIIGCVGVLLETDLDDGLLKTKYLWKFDGADDASIVFAFEGNRLVL